MALRGTTLLVLAGLASFSAACSSHKDGAGSANDTGGTDGAPKCDPNDEHIPCFEGKTDPCDPLNTGFPGDEYCMKPPVGGFQLHVGPTNYDDPDEIAQWRLPPGGYSESDPQAAYLGTGTDVNWCYYMKTPNDQDMFTAGYYAHMRPGSHHYIMFGLPEGTDVPDSTHPESCASRNSQIAGGANFLSGATRTVQNATMFGDAPEDTDLGSPVPAHSQLNMNLHFVNITDHDVLQEIWVNMMDKPADEVKNIIKAIEWLGGLGMNIQPGTKEVLNSGSAQCSPPFDNTRILGVTAHMHANTVRVSMFHQPGGTGEQNLVFDDFNWEEPTVWLFNSVYQNQSPDRAIGQSGSPMNGQFFANMNDKFSWECEVDNKTDGILTFSDKAYTGEMCNVFGMYAEPRASRPWMCFF